VGKQIYRYSLKEASYYIHPQFRKQLMNAHYFVVGEETDESSMPEILGHLSPRTLIGLYNTEAKHKSNNPRRIQNEYRK